MLSEAAGPIASGNLSAFDVIGSKACEVAGNKVVSTENEDSCPGQHRNFKSKSSSPKLRDELRNW